MISFEIILFGLLVVSTLTGLTTEALKKLFAEHNITYRSNTLAGAVALALSIFIGLGYVIISDVIITSHVFIYIIALTFMSWLCAMVGYDKVIQTISQFNTSRKED